MIRHNLGFYLANRNTEQQVIRKGTTYTAPIIQKSQRTMAIIEIGNNQNRLPGSHLSPFIHTTVQVPGTVTPQFSQRSAGKVTILDQAATNGLTEFILGCQHNTPHFHNPNCSTRPGRVIGRIVSATESPSTSI